ncbi:hypothetical protein [Halodurantibacterium flavum]|uniref:Uncharacterized protein n=1 Tax=Halodurantibacterium flavum TaxID=1382802 RepID=A0ABW4S9I2_9RHOB
MTLLDILENTEFTDAGTALFTELASNSATDESALVVLAAAAALLARGAVNDDALLVSCCEFAEVAEEMHRSLINRQRRAAKAPVLRLVGRDGHISTPKGNLA